MNRLAWLSGICAVLLTFIAVPAPAQQVTASFDHSKTAFPLKGAHIAVECVTCHLNGVLKGTPKQCAACHNGTLALGKPANHLPSIATCDTCHTNTLSFGNAPMNHAGIASNCTNCHNGQTFYGVTPVSKTSIHMSTAPGQDCVACHRSFVSFAGASFIHPANASGNCYSCHGTGSSGAMPENASHVPTGSASCDACHKSTTVGGFAVFSMGTAGHTALGVSSASDCTSCHTGSYFGVTAKPAAHPATNPANENCADCHNNFTSFGSASYVHPGSTAGQCYTCHGTGTGGAMVENATHAPTGTTSCDACHTSTVSGGFASFTMGTAGHTALGVSMASDCTTCHIGSYFGVMVKPSTHIATTPANQNCAASGCHTSFTSFAGTTYTHTSSATGQCYTCHGTGSGGAMMENATHVPTGTVSCDACHTSTVSGGFASFAMGSTGHSALGVGLTSDCTSCHTGSYYGVMVKPSSHITTSPANQNCSASGCHTSFTSFAGTAYTHTTSSAGQCYTCHGTGTGGAMVENATHVPTGTVSCDACHTSTAAGGFAAYTMGTAGHTALGVSITSTCTACHAASYFGVMVKPATHVATTLNCENCYDCHKTFTSFAGASYSHPSTATGQCNTCHAAGNTMGAMVEVSTHVPTASVSCDVCHKVTTAGGFATQTMGNTGHAALGAVLSTSNCMTCHSGTYFATKTFKPHPGKHNATAATANFCGTCHKSFTQDPGGG
jgi:hypothetical protein